MHTEPNLTHDQIRAFIQTQFAITTPSLEFVADGECSWMYRIATPTQQRFVLKLNHVEMCAEGYTTGTVKMLQALYYDFGITQTHKPPIRAKSGQHLNKLGDYTAIMLEHVDGKTAQDEPPNETQLKALGSLLAKLHQCKLSKDEKPPDEDFSKKLTVNWVKMLQEFNMKNDKRTALQQQTIQFIRAYIVSLKPLYERFIELHKKFRADPDLKKRLVMSHDEPTNQNVVLLPNGQVFLINWEKASFSPAERDLWFWREKPAVLEGYKRVLPNFNPNADVYDFYALVWDLSQVTELAHRILFKTQKPEQSQHDFTALQAHLSKFKREEPKETKEDIAVEIPTELEVIASEPETEDMSETVEPSADATQPIATQPTVEPAPPPSLEPLADDEEATVKVVTFFNTTPPEKKAEDTPKDEE